MKKFQVHQIYGVLRYGNKYVSPFLVNLSGISQVNKTVLRRK